MTIRDVIRDSHVYLRNALKQFSTVVRLHNLLVSTYVELMEYKHSLKYQSPVDSKNVLYVDPEMIQYEQAPSSKFYKKPQYNRYRSYIETGDWDLQRRPLKEHPLYNFFKQRFVEGKSWEDLGYFDDISTEIDNGNTPWGYETLSQFKNDLTKYDMIYNDIKTNGYKTQRQLIDEGKVENRFSKKMDEILVNIGRDGEILLEDALHRTIIAKIIGLSKVPVRVFVRHSQWQKMRETVYVRTNACQESADVKVRSHPDIPLEQ